MGVSLRAGIAALGSGPDRSVSVNRNQYSPKSCASEWQGGSLCIGRVLRRASMDRQFG